MARQEESETRLKIINDRIKTNEHCQTVSSILTLFVGAVDRVFNICACALVLAAINHVEQLQVIQVDSQSRSLFKAKFRKLI